MTTVFFSGSRRINCLNKEIRDRLGNVLAQCFNIIIGDANGADKAFQKYLSELNYSNVTVYCAGNLCRNNVGSWHINHVDVDPKLKGRDFYTQKDKVMATKADYGFILWDGKSPGSFNNIMELLKYRKKALVYFLPNQSFHTILQLEDAKHLLNKIDQSSKAEISKKIGLGAITQEIQNMGQGVLSF